MILDRRDDIFVAIITIDLETKVADEFIAVPVS